VLFAIPTLHILSARYLLAKAAAPAPLQITYLGLSVPHNLISLQLLPAQSSDEPKADLSAFLETLQAAAYPRTKPRRRVYLVVNPVGGPGKARKMTQKVVLPALEAAGCTVTLVETRSSGQAIEFGRELDVDSYECVPA
jgi:sphingosine kinase